MTKLKHTPIKLQNKLEKSQWTFKNIAQNKFRTVQVAETVNVYSTFTLKLTPKELDKLDFSLLNNIEKIR